MEKENWKSRLNGGFLDSMDYIQKTAVKNKTTHPDNMSNIYDEMASIITDKKHLEFGLDYFLWRKDFKEDRFYAIGLLLDFAKNRLPEIDLFDYVLKASKQCYDEPKEKTPLKDIPKEKTIDYIISQNELKKSEVAY